MYRPAAVTRRRNPLGAFLLPPSAFFIRFNFPFWRLVFLVAGILQENKGMENGPERKVEGKREEKMRFCVTGATGYIGSWLVNTLLQRGYMVHATLRDPEKAAHLLPSWSSCDRLRLFKADLLNEGSFDEAVKGCNGVYHVAASMEFNVMATENIGNAPLNYSSITSIGMKSGAEMEVFDDSSLFELEEAYVQSNIIDPAIKGTLNLLKACLKSKTVERVVFTSSISTITAKDSLGRWRAVVDESCQTPIDHVWKTRAGGWVYVLSKLLTEEAAFQFAKENGIDLVSVITTTVGGPFITSSVPSSIRVLLSPITGEPEFFSILSAVNSRMGSLALVHIEDICNAHIFLMEQAKAEGRYICGVQSYQMSELINHLAKVYPCSNIQRLVEEECGSAPSEICSKKLNDLGFNYKYGLEDIIQQTINCCLDHGFLPQIRR